MSAYTFTAKNGNATTIELADALYITRRVQNIAAEKRGGNIHTAMMAQKEFKAIISEFGMVWADALHVRDWYLKTQYNPANPFQDGIA